MVRLCHLAAFLGIPTVIQAGLVASRGDDTDTTIRVTAITSIVETILRHSPSSLNQSATKPPVVEPLVTSTHGGTLTETPDGQDPSPTEGPASSAKNDSSASSKKTEPSRSSAHVKTWGSSAKTGGSITSVDEETTSNPTEKVLSSAAGDTEITGTSISAETSRVSTVTATQTSSAAPTQRLSNETFGAEILPPSRDPWYRAPDNFAVVDRGELIKRRETPGNLTAKLNNLASSHQLMYRHDDTWGKPAWAVTTLLSPKKHDPLAPNFVTYQAAYNTANVDGSPSYLLSTGSADMEWYLLDRMLERGWHVSVTDYQGPFASFMAGKMSGHAVLDAMRLLYKTAPGLYGVDFHFMRQIAWGYSGGALATAWAFAELRNYSLDMEGKFRHFVIGGFPMDPIEMIQKLDGQEEAGMALHALSALMTEFRHVNGTIQLAAKTRGPSNITVFDRVKTLTRAETKREFAYKNLSDYFVNSLDHVVRELRGHQPRKQRLDFPKSPNLVKLVLPRRIWKHMLIYHGVYDQIAPIEQVDKLLTKKYWCQRSMAIEYYRAHVGSHFEVKEAAVETVLTWMARRFRVMQYWAHETTAKTPNKDEHHHFWKCERIQAGFDSDGATGFEGRDEEFERLKDKIRVREGARLAEMANQ